AGPRAPPRRGRRALSSRARRAAGAHRGPAVGLEPGEEGGGRMRTTPGCALPPLRTRHPGARAAAANGGHAVVPHRRRTRPAGRASRGGQPILVKGAVVPQPRIWADRLQARLGTTRYLVTVGTAASADIAVVPIGSPPQFRGGGGL